MMPALDAAYRATTYRVFLPVGPCDLRIGEANGMLRDWLLQTAHECFALVTAYNPGSQDLGAALNAERQAELEADLLDGDYAFLAAEHRADGANWPVEAGCFVPGLSRDDACALGAGYGQNAVVCGGSDGVPHLVWIVEEERE